MKRYEVAVADGYIEGSGCVDADSLGMALDEFLRESSISKSNIRKATIIECPWNIATGWHSISKSHQGRLKECTDVR